MPNFQGEESRRAVAREGSTVAHVRDNLPCSFLCGPVGQFAIASALLLQAGRVLAIDCVESRLEMARDQGAEVIDFECEDPVEVLRELTSGSACRAVTTKMQTRTRARLRRARLRYVADTSPGIRRRKQGRGVVYENPHGRPITSSRVLKRIESLAIPPAWTDVWISPHALGHIQATGRDERGRKQYRYHPQWSETTNQLKFHQLPEFGRRLPRIRRAVARDLRRRKLSRERVVAAVVALLDDTMIRVGNEQYVRENGSYGLTTLRQRHVETDGQHVRIRFRGKGGILHEVQLNDRRLGRLIESCHELPGHELFQYVNGDNQYQTVGSHDVNEYLADVSGAADFTSKTFRTWKATVLVTGRLARQPQPSSAAEGRRTVNDAYREAAAALGNTPATCRKYYVDPSIPEAFHSGKLQKIAATAVLRGSRLLNEDERLLMHTMAKLHR